MRSLCELLGRAICGAVDDVRTRACHLVTAVRVFENAPPSVHVVAAAIAGAAPAALPDVDMVTRVLVGPVAQWASNTVVSWIAADASARIFERAGRPGELPPLASLASLAFGGRNSGAAAGARRFVMKRLTSGAIDLVPGISGARRILEATEGALLAARFVALAERHAKDRVRARAARITVQAADNDNGIADWADREEVRERARLVRS